MVSNQIHEQKVMDFQEYTQGKKIDELTTQAVVYECLCSLVDITQEINVVINMWGSVMQDARKYKVLEKIGTDVGNTTLYEWTSLFALHGENLLKVSRVLDRMIHKPSAEEMVLVDETLKVLANDYAKTHKTILDRKLEKVIDDWSDDNETEYNHNGERNGSIHSSNT